jgi:hypothetical protein
MIKILLFCLLKSTPCFSDFQPVNDSTAIKQLLAKESATWRAGDVKGHAECWQIRPYSKILVSIGNGMFVNVPPDAIINPSPNNMGNGGTSSNSNFQFSIHENNAWVCHDEESTDKNGNKTYSTEIRLLEKVNGQWKLVGQSIHIHQPK